MCGIYIYTSIYLLQYISYMKTPKIKEYIYMDFDFGHFGRMSCDDAASSTTSLLDMYEYI